MQIHNRIIKTR